MDKDTVANKNPHAHHRQRLYALAEKVGVENLSDIQMLELLLSYIIPRKDTNEIAHELLNEFETFSNVLDAPIHALEKINGVGHRTAQMISFMKGFFFLYRTKDNTKKVKFNNRKDIIEYVEKYMKFSKNEELYAIATNVNMEVIKIKKLAEGTTTSININIKVILDFISTYSPDGIILAHSHGDSQTKPSIEDIQTTKVIKSLLSVSNVKFIDHLIVGKDQTFSFFNNNLIN